MINFNYYSFKQYYNFGVKVFSRLSKRLQMSSEFRLTQEGLAALLPFIGKEKIIEISKMQLESILLREAHNWDKNCEPLKDGCYVFLFKLNITNCQTISIPISAALFRNTIIPFVNYNQKLHILRVAGVTKLKLEDKEREKNDDYCFESFNITE